MRGNVMNKKKEIVFDCDIHNSLYNDMGYCEECVIAQLAKSVEHGGNPYI